MRRACLSLGLLAGALAGSLGVAGLIVWAAGYPPLEVGRDLWAGAVGQPPENLWEWISGQPVRRVSWKFLLTLQESCPLILCGLAVTIAFRCGVWNIGAEGQYLLGALAATQVGVLLGAAGRPVALPATLLAGGVAGAAWAMVPGVLKACRGVQEVLSTILLNFVAVGLVAFCVLGPLRDRTATADPVTREIGADARLAILAPGTAFHSGFLVAVAGAVVLHVLLYATVFGLRVRAVGHSPEAARFAGIPVRRYTLLTFALSGLLAGLAGAVQVSGVRHFMGARFGSDYGYTAIAVALLARLQPLAVVPAAIFFAALETGVSSLQRDTGFGPQGFPHEMVYVVQAVIILMVLLAGRGLARRNG